MGNVEEFVQTRSSLIRSNAAEQFNVVTFTTKGDNVGTNVSDKTIVDKHSNISDRSELDLKKVRQDVIKFGISGFDPKKKHEAMIAQLVRLGAKPPKRKYKNYKVLMEERKTQRAQEVNRLALMNIGKDEKGFSTTQTNSNKRKKSKNDVGALLKTYGKPTLKGISKQKSRS